MYTGLLMVKENNGNMFVCINIYIIFNTQLNPTQMTLSEMPY
jgi:hypothetical protein